MPLAPSNTPRKPARDCLAGDRRAGTIRRCVVAACAGLALIGGTGCQSGSMSPMAIWRLGHDNSLSKPPTQSELGDDRNFFAKLVSPKSPPATNPNPPSLVLGSDGWKPMQQPVNPEAEGEFRAALALFQQEKYPEAEKAFATLA